MQQGSKQVGSVLVTDPCAAPDDPETAGDARLEVAVKVLDPELPLPRYAHPGDAGDRKSVV